MQESWSAELEASVRTASLESGFGLIGIASAEQDREDRFAAWVDSGYAGEMEYLKRRDEEGRFLRSAVSVALPWARSVIVCALDYSSQLPSSLDPAPPGSGWIGRYAWSGKRDESDPARLLATDYHGELLTRLKAVEAKLLESATCQTRCYVDTGPIVEREYAAKAGIGWIAKNTCVLSEERGSWLLLGVIVTSLPFESSITNALAADRCGSCTRCIDACPTNALIAPREMDASRCIAYLTIEKKGTIDAVLREGMGRQIFGCDICQDVCPWNERMQRRRNLRDRSDVTAVMEPRPDLVNPSLAWLAGMDNKDFKRYFRGSPLERTGLKRLRRNIAIAMGNSGDFAFMPRLQDWAASEDAVLADTAAWAIERLRRMNAVC